MAPTIHEVRFPTAISRRASGGPERRTEIVTLYSGHEERNTRWAHSRRKYNAGYGVRSLNDLHAVLEFFEERRGRLYGFRWKDPVDFRSCPPDDAVTPGDQFIATGDGTTAQFQLIKTYGTSDQSYTRAITKPVAGTVIVAVDGVAGTEGADFTIDTETGIITFQAGSIPAAGEGITAGFEFDVPVRFDTDSLEVSLTAFSAGQIPDIAIIEIKS